MRQEGEGWLPGTRGGKMGTTVQWVLQDEKGYGDGGDGCTMLSMHLVHRTVHQKW